MLPQTPCFTRIYILTQTRHTTLSYLRLHSQPPTPEERKPEPPCKPQTHGSEANTKTQCMWVLQKHESEKSRRTWKGRIRGDLEPLNNFLLGKFGVEEEEGWGAEDGWGRGRRRLKRSLPQRASRAPASCPPYYFSSPLTKPGGP